MRKFNLIAALVLLLTVVISGIAAQENTPEPTPAEAEDITATEEMAATDEGTMTFVRFAHFSADSDAVDIYVDGELTDTVGLGFAEVSEWIALPGGAHDVAVAPTGGSVSDAVLSSAGVDLPAGGWFTVAVVGSGADGTLAPVIVQENILPLDEVLPGTATYTFFNALGDGTTVNFLRDDVPYVASLGSGADNQFPGFSTITEDAGEHTFGATLTENDEVITSLDTTEIVETSAYLIALVGGDEPQLIVFETPRADLEIAQGKLAEPGTIVEAAQSYELLQPFAALLEQAGLSDVLSGEGPYTVFVPADFALDDVPAGTDVEALLLNHVVEGNLKSMQVGESTTLTTLGGQQLTVALDGNVVTVNGNQVIAVNIPATNGTIHVINGVLTPTE